MHHGERFHRESGEKMIEGFIRFYSCAILALLGNTSSSLLLHVSKGVETCQLQVLL
jgi:hypothetical protein